MKRIPTFAAVLGFAAILTVSLVRLVKVPDFAGRAVNQSADDYLKSAHSLYAQGKLALCLEQLSKLKKLTPSYKDSIEQETLCKDPARFIENWDDKAIKAKADEAALLSISDLNCRVDSDCTYVAPRGCGGYHKYKWVTSKKNIHLREIQKLADDLWEHSLASAEMYRCDFRARKLECQRGKCF